MKKDFQGKKSSSSSGISKGDISMGEEHVQESQGPQSQRGHHGHGPRRTRLKRQESTTDSTSGEGENDKVRIQVTLHKSLKWQVSASSSLTSTQSTSMSPRHSRILNLNKILKSQSVSLSDSVSISLSPSSTFSCPCPMVSVYHNKRHQRHPQRHPQRQRQQYLPLKPLSLEQEEEEVKERDADSSSSKEDEEDEGERPSRLSRNRGATRRRRKIIKPASSSEGKTKAKGHNHSSFLVKLPSSQGSTSKAVDLDTCDINSNSPAQLGDEILQSNGHHEEVRSSPQEDMTWFKKSSQQQQQDRSTNKKSGMGAGNSREVDNHRLNLRSQSSSALFSTKANNTSIGIGINTATSTSNGHLNLNHKSGHHQGAPSHHHQQYQPHPHQHLSNSIPADLWDANSFSPLISHKGSPKHSNVKHQHQPIQTQQGHPHPHKPQSILKGQGQHKMPSAIIESINTCRSKKGNKSRSKLYAVSCPDVAQEAQASAAAQCGQYYQFNHQNLGHESLGQREDDLVLFLPPEGFRSNNSNPLTQSHPHLYVLPPPPPQQQQQSHFHAPSCPISAMSASYQHIPNAFYPPPQHYQHGPFPTPNNLNQQSQISSSSAMIHQHPTSKRGGRSSLPNQRSCDVPLLGSSSSQETGSGSTQNISKDSLDSIFPAFVIPENIFEVRLQRDGRGLGLSVTGGRDTEERYPGLIRIKKVFPLSPAADCGVIKAWDVILQANGIPLTGLTNHEALSVLRTTPTETVLTLCRAPPKVPGFCDPESNSNSNNMTNTPSYKSFSHSHSTTNTASTSSMSFKASAAKSKSLTSLKLPLPIQQQQQSCFGEFEVTLEKVAGSLGFTLRQEDSSILGHYVRALVKDPALSDGRLQPGDRILSVNGRDLSEMSHGEAISFLRQCGSVVTLRMYRDQSPTPVSPLSPSESQKSILLKTKTKPLRQEAIDMLNDLAIRKQLNSSGDSKYSLPGSMVGRTGLRSHKVSANSNVPATLPRRRHPAPSSQVLTAALNRFAAEKNSRSSLFPSEARSSGSGESTPIVSIKERKSENEMSQDQQNSSFHSEDEETTPIVTPRATSFRQFTLHLDRISSLEDDDHQNQFNSELTHNHSIVSEPSCPKNRRDPFRQGQFAYQSAMASSSSSDHYSKKEAGPRGKKNSLSALSDVDIPSSLMLYSHNHNLPDLKLQTSSSQQKDNSNEESVDDTEGEGDDSLDQGNNLKGSLQKWKGVLFQEDRDQFSDDGNEDDESRVKEHDGGSGDVNLGKNPNFLGLGGSGELPKRRSPDGREFKDCDMEISSVTKDNGEQIFTVQLSRRWCSRLGFSLQGSEGNTYISAIYPDSVAAKDGRLRVGDEVVMVNGDTIRDMDTSDVIDNMRKTRGTISITILRKPNNNFRQQQQEIDSNNSDSDLGLR